MPKTIRFSNPVYLRAISDVREAPPRASFIAFAGRSNAGKSSVINALCGGRYARVSRLPGRTRAIQLFDLGDILLADLPGYGYAAASKQEKRNWGEQTTAFLMAAPLSCLVAVVDCRRGVNAMDQQLFEFCRPRQTPTLLLLNKTDKLNRQQQKNALVAAGELPSVTAMLFSAMKRVGVEEARQFIGDCCQAAVPTTTPMTLGETPTMTI